MIENKSMYWGLRKNDLEMDMGKCFIKKKEDDWESRWYLYFWSSVLNNLFTLEGKIEKTLIKLTLKSKSDKLH